MRCAPPRFAGALRFWSPGMTTDVPDPVDAAISSTEQAFGRFVPRQFLQLLGKPGISDIALGDHVEQQMSLLFSDIRDFTMLSESILPAENFRFINSYLSTMEPVVGSHRGFIDKYIGDGIMALFPGTADDAVRCGIAMLRELVNYNEGRLRAGYMPIRIGIGVNTGLVMMGTVGGHNRMETTVIGDAVNQTARLETLTKTYRTPFLISEHTLHDLGDPSAYDIRFIDRLKIKGNYPAQSVFEVFDADPEPLRRAKRETRPLFLEAVSCYHIGALDKALPLLRQCIEASPDDHAAYVYLDRCRHAQANEPYAALPRIEQGWNESYPVGSAGIDRDYAFLLESMANLFHAVSGKRNADEIAASLADRFEEHFGAQENLMRRYDYPFAAEHQRQHAALVQSFEALRRAIRTHERSTMRLLMDIQVTLIDWYVNHITKSDAHLGHHLQRAGVS